MCDRALRLPLRRTPSHRRRDAQPASCPCGRAGAACVADAMRPSTSTCRATPSRSLPARGGQPRSTSRTLGGKGANQRSRSYIRLEVLASGCEGGVPISIDSK
eukprot:15442710-Alexandrium_andersonii.AAC.1